MYWSSSMVDLDRQVAEQLLLVGVLDVGLEAALHGGERGGGDATGERHGRADLDGALDGRVGGVGIDAVVGVDGPRLAGSAAAVVSAAAAVVLGAGGLVVGATGAAVRRSSAAVVASVLVVVAAARGDQQRAGSQRGQQTCRCDVASSHSPSGVVCASGLGGCRDQSARIVPVPAGRGVNR